MRYDRAPATVRTAFGCWLLAVGAGVLETCLVLAREGGAGTVAGLAVRVIVFVAAVAVAWRMLAGHRWARWALAVGLGLVGLSSLVADPIAWLAGGGSISRLLAGSGTADLVFGASRTVHVAAVVAGVVLMFTPSANTWFRTGAATRAGSGGGPAPGTATPR